MCGFRVAPDGGLAYVPPAMHDRGTIARRAERLLLFTFVLLASGALGCTPHRPVLICPTGGGPSWNQLTTPRFVLKTDLPPDKARRIAVDLELSWAALRAVLGAPADETPVRVLVVVFERRQDFAAINGTPGLSGYFMSRIPGDVEFQPAMVSFDGLGYTPRRVLQHELTHLIVRSRTFRFPWWLDEGLAETYSTLRIEGDRAIAFEPPRDVDFWEAEHAADESGVPIPKRWLPVSQAPSAADLAFADRSLVEASVEPRLYYAAAWKMIHVLRGDVDARQAPRFRSMLRSLMSGTPGSQAFAEAYGEATLDDFEDTYRQILLDRREFPESVKLILPAAAQPVVTPMSDAEVHALWATLVTVQARAGISAEEEIQRGLTENPRDHALIFARASIRLRREGAAAAQLDIWDLLKVDHRDARYRFLDLLAALQGVRGEQDEMSAKIGLVRLSAAVNELLPLAATPARWFYAALALERLKRQDEALAIVGKAVEADPTCAACFALRADLLLESGQPAAAGEAIERALSLRRDDVALPELEELQQRIERALASPPGR